MALTLRSSSSSSSLSIARPLPLPFCRACRAGFGFTSISSSSSSESRTPLFTLTPVLEAGLGGRGEAEVRGLVFGAGLSSFVSSSESDKDMTADGLLVPRCKTVVRSSRVSTINQTDLWLLSCFLPRLRFRLLELLLHLRVRSIALLLHIRL